MSFFHALLSSDGIMDTNASNQQAFLVIGDSIAKGTNSGTKGPGPTPTSGTAYYYRRSNNTVIEIGANDLEFAPEPVSNGSPWPQFAINYNAATGKKAVMIPTGIGGSNFANQGTANDCWDPTVSGSLYSQSVTDAQSCMSILGVLKLKGIIINLGINDARGTVAVADIETSINAFFAQLISDFPGVPILLAQIGRSETVQSIDSRIGSVRKYLRTVAENNTSCHILATALAMPASNMIGSDSIHPTQPGNNEFGACFARFFINSTYIKWARSIIASHFDDLSTTRKDLIQTLISGNQSSYLNHDCLFNLKTTIKNNCFLDWAFLSCPVDLGFTFSANSHISSPGTGTTCFRSAWHATHLSYKSSQDDIFKSSKLKLNSVAAGTLGAVFGAIDASSVATRVYQTTVNNISFSANDGTATDVYSGETKLADNTEYLVGRNGGTKYLYKNGSQVASAATASTGVCGRSQTEMAELNDTVLAKRLNGQIQDIRGGKFTGVDVSAFYTAMEALRSGW